jgi:quercetin dioxygenase-like cupin family protein
MSTAKRIKDLEDRGFADVQVVDFGDERAEFSEHTHDTHTVHDILHGELIVKEGDEITTYIVDDVVEFPIGTTHSVKCGADGCRMLVGFKR